MPTSELTQADALRALPKRRADDKEWEYSGLGGGISVPLTSTDGRERFHLDIRKGRINLSKGSYQNRARRAYVLVRLCFGGSTHNNPDGQRLGPRHIHL